MANTHRHWHLKRLPSPFAPHRGPNKRGDVMGRNCYGRLHRVHAKARCKNSIAEPYDSIHALQWKPPAQCAGISLPERIPAKACVANLRYKSCPEMEVKYQNKGLLILMLLFIWRHWSSFSFYDCQKKKNVAIARRLQDIQLIRFSTIYWTGFGTTFAK